MSLINVLDYNLLTKSWVRYLILSFFIAVFVFTIINGTKLPVLLAMFTISILLTFLFPEELWHRYLCPYGAIMSQPAKKANYYMEFDSNQCINCGMCKDICPAKAIKTNDEYHEINKHDCLVCMECSRTCLN